MNYLLVIEDVFKQYKGPKFTVKLWDDKKRVYGKGSLSTFTLIIKNATTVKRLLSEGSLGFGESFMNGSLDIEGNIEDYLRLRHHFKKVHFSPRLIIAKFLSDRTVPKDRQSQISYHYDLGSDFFQMFLDKKTMSYSSGRYTTLSSLESAQENKLNYIIKWLNLPQNSSVLDLGSGWGGFALYAAKKRKLHVTGYTLSKEQLSYCKNLIKQNNVENMATFRYQDMLADFPAKKFDGVVSIESIEHVGRENLPSFFHKISSVVKKNGPLIIQLTGRYIPKRVDRWTLQYVFPGGYLPAKDELLLAAEEAGFIVEEFHDDTEDYIKTMTEWIKRLENKQSHIENMFDKRFYRLWYLWMHGAKVNFELGEMSLFRIKLRKT